MEKPIMLWLDYMVCRVEMPSHTTTEVNKWLRSCVIKLHFYQKTLRKLQRVQDKLPTWSAESISVWEGPLPRIVWFWCPLIAGSLYAGTVSIRLKTNHYGSSYQWGGALWWNTSNQSSSHVSTGARLLQGGRSGVANPSLVLPGGGSLSKAAAGKYPIMATY